MSLLFKESSYYFNANVHRPLQLVVNSLRTEEQYDQDHTPENTALRYIRLVAGAFNGNAYLLTSYGGTARVRVGAKKSF